LAKFSDRSYAYFLGIDAYEKSRGGKVLQLEGKNSAKSPIVVKGRRNYSVKGTFLTKIWAGKEKQRIKKT
jgi:hypothetical protein